MPECIVLGVDFGLRRIGLAIGNTLTGTARALEIVAAGNDPVAAVTPTIREWQPQRIIIGLPLAGDGSETDTSRAVRAFADRLQAAHPDKALTLHDERNSSQVARQHFAEARREGRARRREGRRVDALAAAEIVRRWLTERTLPA
ncbi:MAG: Holliday junction resolvase RuvX [Wenzhouxiangellaceae bacterium]|nr:Holliday junction resolvase RuvX [Wenzhouxiangellaceae bacterium]